VRNGSILSRIAHAPCERVDVTELSERDAGNSMRRTRDAASETPDDVGDRLELDGLAEVGIEPGAECPPVMMHFAECGDGEGRRPSPLFAGKRPDLSDQPVPVPVWHGEIGDDHVRPTNPEHRERITARASHHDLSAAVPEQELQELPGVVVVVHHEEAQPAKNVRGDAAAPRGWHAMRPLFLLRTRLCDDAPFSPPSRDPTSRDPR
jgi:hypothetical protein